jgi:diaminohydroxyphosphoribosylaminopyrimidine deaminase/5-amino-6-(5-phosphoribosylamino)uracil reductase
MVGIGTALADDPLLTARDAQGRTLPRQPLRVVADSRGRLPANARLLAEPGKALVAVAREDAEAKQRPPGLAGLQGVDADVFRCPGSDGRVDLNALLHELGRREITSVLVEGGGTLLGSLFDLGLVDKVVAFVAPVIIGGESAPSAVGGQGAERMSDAMRLDRVAIRQFGDDVAVIGYPAKHD